MDQEDIQMNSKATRISSRAPDARAVLPMLRNENLSFVKVNDLAQVQPDLRQVSKLSVKLVVFAPTMMIFLRAAQASCRLDVGLCRQDVGKI